MTIERKFSTYERTLRAWAAEMRMLEDPKAGDMRRRDSTANRLARRYYQLGLELAQDATGRHLIEALLNDSDLSVQCAVAFLSLRWNPTRAVPLLERLTGTGGIVGLRATYALRQWRSLRTQDESG